MNGVYLTTKSIVLVVLTAMVSGGVIVYVLASFGLVRVLNAELHAWTALLLTTGFILFIAGWRRVLKLWWAAGQGINWTPGADNNYLWTNGRIDMAQDEEGNSP